MKSIKFSCNLLTNTHKRQNSLLDIWNFFVGYSNCFIIVNNYEVVELFLLLSA